ncbi:MAG: glycosyltransferase [Planctomycetota bacterium]|nr:glycosyltransferase [Planctomycetota bacterium]
MTRPQLSFLVQPDQRDRARIRYSPLLPYLHEANCGADLLVLPGKRKDRIRVLRELAPGRIIVLPAHLYSEPNLALIRNACKGLVLDLDDAVFCRPWDRKIAAPSKTRDARFRMSLEAQDAVVTAGPYLRKYLRNRHDEPFLRMIPNPIEDPGEVDAPRLEEKKELRLLWIGSESTLGYLDSILPSLNRFAKEHPETVLTVVSDAFPQAQEFLKIDRVPWSIEAQRLALKSSSIGLMPLDEHPWSLGKSGFKVLQYMSAGLAVISSRHGNGEFLLGKNYPYFADSAEAWLESLERLKKSAEQRSHWGYYLKEEARRRCHPRVIAKSWLSLAEEIDARLGS